MTPDFPSDDAYRVERVLATARLVVAVAFAVLLQAGALAGPSATGILTVCSITYLLYSGLVFVALRPARSMSARGTAILHAGDLVWAGVCTWVDGDAVSAFFALHIFAVLAAAYRWGLKETLATAAVSVALVVVEPYASSLLLPVTAQVVPLDAQAMFRQIAYVVITAYLGGYLADEDRRLRERALIRARLVASAKSEHGFFASVQAVAAEARRAFGARDILLAVDDRDTRRSYLMTSVPGAATPLGAVELPPDRRAHYLFSAPAAWAGVAKRSADPDASGGAWDWIALDIDGRRTEPRAELLPRGFMALHPCRAVAAVSYTYGDQSMARLVLVDPSHTLAREDTLRFFQQLVGELGPVVHGIYLYRHLRRRAGAIERARMAREIHDGVIQSLIGVEMSLEALRLRLEAIPPAGIRYELQLLQRSVHEEVLNLRDLMEQIKPRDVGPAQLVEHLIDVVDRFRRDSGIEASFTSDVEELALPPAARRELARILHEALINVRKHSGARHAVVRLHQRDSAYHLTIDDDGRGFDFEGRLPQEALDAERRGPVVIKERVRAIGGALTIESAPGRGARLEIVVPFAAAPERN